MKDKKRLSKGSEIDYDSFQTRKYLLSGTGFSSDSMKLIFSVRSRDLAVRGNFANSHKELKCVVKECPEKIESQYHLFSCPFLASSDEVIPNDLSYDDIFANNVRKQFQVMEIMRERLRRRNEYEKDSCDDSPLDPRTKLVIRKARRSRSKKKRNNKNYIQH